MENKPLHYDGSIQSQSGTIDQNANESFKLTEEMRMNISGNPFVSENNE